MPIDIIVIILLIIACIKGFQKGLIIAVFSVVAFVIGLAAALKLSTVVAEYLKTSVNITAKWLPFISFALVFIGVIVLVKLGAKLIEKTVKLALLGWVNRIGGILFYATLYLIIFSVFLFYAEKIKLFQSGSIQSSVTYPYIHNTGPFIINGIGKVIPLFKDMFQDLTTFFEGFSNKKP